MCVHVQIFNMPVNLAQGTSVMYAYIIGFSQAPLTALQVRSAAGQLGRGLAVGC
jgi:hypothetical protein